MKSALMSIAIDDGSSNVKASWIEKGRLKTVVSPNSFRKDWKSAALLSGHKIHNYSIGSTKYTYDAISERALATTHIEFQYGDLNLLAVHHALFQTGLAPCPVKIVATLAQLLQSGRTEAADTHFPSRCLPCRSVPLPARSAPLPASGRDA